MNKLLILLAAAFGSLVLSVRAQDTNLLKTDLGVFEARTGAVIIRGFGQIGSVVTGTDTIAVLCKQSQNLTTGQKVYGLAIEIAGNAQTRERTYVDYDEIDSLLSGINYLNTITYDATPMPAFEAAYATKTGLRVIASSARRQGGIQVSLQYGAYPRISLTSEQMTQFSRLIEQARNNLDALRNAK